MDVDEKLKVRLIPEDYEGARHCGVALLDLPGYSFLGEVVRGCHCEGWVATCFYSYQ